MESRRHKIYFAIVVATVMTIEVSAADKSRLRKISRMVVSACTTSVVVREEGDNVAFVSPNSYNVT